MDKNVIKLTYLTSFGSQRQTTFLLDTITEIKVKKKLFFIRDFGSLKISQRETQSSFSLYNANINPIIDTLMQNISDTRLLKNT